MNNKIKIINSKLHGFLDYAIAIVLFIPWITTYEQAATDTWIFTGLGAATAIYSLLTNYEFGLIKLIPMKIHLFLDLAEALFLLMMPFLFSVNHYLCYWPLILGTGEILVLILSSTEPYNVTRNEMNITSP